MVSTLGRAGVSPYAEEEAARTTRFTLASRAKDVKVTQTDVLQAVHASKYLRVDFANVFCDPIGRNRFCAHGLHFGKSRRFAVRGGGSGQDDTFHFGIAGGNQNI